MSKIKGVIFDFNGVLWWDSHIVERSWSEFVLQKYNKQLTKETFQNLIHGRSSREIIESFEGRIIETNTLLQLIDEKEHIYKELCLKEGKNFRLSPGAEMLLEMLAKHNIPHTIATSSEIGNITFFFKHLKLTRWFDFDKVVYDDGVIPSKPAPDLYLKAARNLGFTTESCLVVEDAKSGIIAAEKAGIGTIIALGPKETHGKLKTYGRVSQTIEKLNEIIPLVSI